jgi:hypothetical protein
MVWTKRVQLRRDEEAFKRKRSGSSGGGIEVPRQRLEEPGTPDELDGGIELGPGGFSPTRGVHG